MRPPPPRLAWPASLTCGPSLTLRALAHCRLRLLKDSKDERRFLISETFDTDDAEAFKAHVVSSPEFQACQSRPPTRMPRSPSSSRAGKKAG